MFLSNKGGESVYYSIFHLFTRRVDASYENANFFSRLLYTYIKPLLIVGSKKPLEFEDLPPLSYLYMFLKK